ncbi:MAG: hypothetical protein WKF35_08750 [Ferruginibacter sp.]
MKSLLCTMVAIFVMGYSMRAQNIQQANYISLTSSISSGIENQNLMVEWTSDASSDYWEVQGSANGKSFITIGMVLGGEPANIKAFTFKQKIQKIKPGLKYFRVLQIKKDSAVELTNISLSVK